MNGIQADEARLIFLGDCINDRFDCASVVTETMIIRTLHQCGARFVRGNHDAADRGYTHASIELSRADIEARSKSRTENDKQYISETVSHYMCPAYYDKTNNILFCHNGISLSSDKKAILWGAPGADIPVEDIFRASNNEQDYAGNILAREIALHNALYNEDALDYIDGSKVNFDTFQQMPTSFRPSLDDISEAAAYLNLNYVVCGHNGIGARKQNKVVQLNSVRENSARGIITARTLNEINDNNVLQGRQCQV